MSKLDVQTAAQFLSEKIRAIRTNQSTGKKPEALLHLVLGNQSADMDSIASAISYAYAYDEQMAMVPLINISREDFALRGDVVYLMQKLSIEPKGLFFREDMPYFLRLAEEGYLRLILVDHNQLAPDQRPFEPYVKSVIDHHHDEKVNYPLIGKNDKTVQSVGSCATLVAEKIFEKAKRVMPPDCAILLLGAILLDTGDLKDSNKVTPQDILAAAKLKKIAGAFYTDHFYAELYERKQAVDAKNPDGLLKKDYKIFQEGGLLYGMASFPKGILWTISNRHEWQNALSGSVHEQKINCIMAMGTGPEGKYLILYVPEVKLHSAILDHLQRNLSEELLIQQTLLDEGLSFFRLKNPLARKQLQPQFNFANYP